MLTTVAELPEVWFHKLYNTPQKYITAYSCPKRKQ